MRDLRETGYYLAAALLPVAVAVAGELPAIENIAHRGFSARCTENQMAAITNAWVAGASMVEVDLRLSADGAVILFHDPEIGDVAVNSLTVAQLRDLDDKLLLLGDILPPPSPDTRYLLDLKGDTREFLDALRREIQPHPAILDNIVFQSRSVDVLRQLHEWFPSAERFYVTSLKRGGPLQQGPEAGPIANMLIEEELDGITAKGRKFITPDYVSQFRDRGLLFYVWTINDEDRILHYSKLGVDGIISDRPDVVRTILDRRK